MYRADRDEKELSKIYPRLDHRHYRIIDHFRYKGQDMILQESRDKTEFCVHYCGNGHYFDTLEDAQMWALKRTKNTHRFEHLIRE